MLAPDFIEEANAAGKRNDRAYLILLGLEAGGFAWQTEAQQLLDDLMGRLPPSITCDHAMLFTGHRIDAADRPNPRLPPEAEERARQRIFDVVIAAKKDGDVTGLAGGANGGDILFLECCREQKVPFKMLLALPEADFVQASVTTSSGDWVRRFYLLADQAKPKQLAATKTLPDWLKQKPDYNFWARNNMWLIASALALSPKEFTLVALWDGGTGDGAGGTENMVKVAQQHGAKLIWLDTRELLIHSATQ